MISSLKRILRAALLLAGLTLASARAADVPPLQLGVLPNVSTRVIMANYQPLRQYLERELNRPVEVVTAPDFKTFFLRTQNGDYDVVVTAANFARLAQTEAGYTALGSYQPAISGLLVMAKSRPVTAIQELRGKVLALANPQSLVALRGMQWLRERGLAAGTDFQAVKAANEDSLGQMVVNGDSLMAMLSSGEFRQIPDAHRRELHVFTVFAEVPSFVWLANRRLPAAVVAAVKSKLVAMPSTDEGRQFLAATGIQGWREIGEADLAALDPFLPETRRMLGVVK